jgi:hypothetical protein
MKITVTIENIGGIFYINGKRLGTDELTRMETIAINEFIREYKELEKIKQN